MIMHKSQYKKHVFKRLLTKLDKIGCDKRYNILDICVENLTMIKLLERFMCKNCKTQINQISELKKEKEKEKDNTNSLLTEKIIILSSIAGLMLKVYQNNNESIFS